MADLRVGGDGVVSFAARTGRCAPSTIPAGIAARASAARAGPLHAPRLSYHAGLRSRRRLVTRTEREFGVKPEEMGFARWRCRRLPASSGSRWPTSARFLRRRTDIGARLQHHGMERAKVAQRVSYTVKANWKLVFENNRECYHCTPNHPEYVKGTYDVARADPRQEAEIRRVTDEANARFCGDGLDTGDVWSGIRRLLARASNAARPGWSTQSLDGSPVAPLMGCSRAQRWSRGTLRMTVFPNFWQHASDDHAVDADHADAADECVVDVWWLVDKDAVEGRDYDLAKLMPFWQCTSEQDWRICSDQQLGVASRGYVPGRYGRRSR